ncbi:MAG TPA: hypothetical protein VGV38_03360 [Pyrinomonadaceae bacterium]|nr:hypothetical protein [Pyrinomonadaceae bacterium]
MRIRLVSFVFVWLSIVFVAASPGACAAQTAEAGSPFAFRAGQAMYIVAFRRTEQQVVVSSPAGRLSKPEYFTFDLDAERKVKKKVEEWGFFKVVDKPSDADFVFLINLDGSSIEALALPYDAYRVHFKDEFDLDSLRDKAHGRYTVGPLNLATLGRLTDRLVKQFREGVSAKGGATASR